MTAEFTGATVLFKQNFDDRTHRIKINQGGTSSGKTYSILQVIALRLVEKKRIATVVGQDIPNLKKGAYRDFSERILPSAPWLQSFIASRNKSSLSYTFTNGSILEFSSFGDEQDAKNGKRDIAFFNEANGIPYAIYKQVAMRTNEEIFIDYNPAAPFWAHDKLMSRDDTVTFYSNYTHNPYISEGALIELRDIKEKDAELWKVYGLGKTGEIGELCIENMKVVDRMPDNLRRVAFGMDFGYRADPTALVRGGIQNENDLYLDLWLYRKHMNLSETEQAMIAAGIAPRDDRTPIFADGADARACDYLRDVGYNLREVKKGPGSIAYGLSLLNQYNIHVTKRSAEMIEERSKYAYKIEKRGVRAGEVTNVPIDAFNHCFIGSTGIQTQQGVVQIKDIIPGDLVATSEGFRPVRNVWQNGVKKVVEYRIVSEVNNVSLVATPDHKIKTDTGWTTLSKLKPGQRIFLLNHSKEKSTGFTQEKGITVEEQSDYTASSTKAKKERYLKGGTFTTLTETPRTTTLTTLRLLSAENTLVTMLSTGLRMIKNGLRSSLMPGLKSRLSGTGHRKALSGTRSTQKSKGSETTPLKISPVSNAKKYSRLKTTRPSFVPTLASQRPEDCQVLTMSADRASNAKGNSPSVNTVKNGTAATLARVLRVESRMVGSAEVYDLAVHDCHEYFANGALVSNCWDAARYYAIEMLKPIRRTRKTLRGGA